MESKNRRFTDQEVALVLRRSAEIEEKAGNSAATRGLTLVELQEIAKEVGFDEAVVAQALMELNPATALQTWQPLGPSPSAKCAVAAEGGLSKEQLKEFVRIIEENAAQPGTVTEALGTIRWISAPEHRLGSTIQVSVTPTENETHVQVHRRYPAKLRAVLQMLPATWGLMIAGAVAAGGALSPLPAVGAAVAAAGAGALVGRGIWHAIARKNEKDTEELSHDLAAIASEISRS